MSDQFDVIVIGAGANGLVAAAALARAGRRVLVLEDGDVIGGQSAPREFAPGFRCAPFGLDAGWVPPSVSKELGGLPPMTSSDVGAAVVDESGALFPLFCGGRPQTELHKRSAKDYAQWPAFMARMAKLRGFLAEAYRRPAPRVDATVGDLGELLGLGRAFRSMGRTGMEDLLRLLPMSVDDLTSEVFENETVRACIAAGGVREIRQGPRSGGTAFALLHWGVGADATSVRARPWWLNRPDEFVNHAAQIARDRGVTIRCGAGVEQIVIDDDRVTGVRAASGDVLTAPSVISTADPVRTLSALVDPVWLDPEILLAVRNIKMRGSTAVVQIASDRLPAFAGLDGRDAARALETGVSLSPTVTDIERAFDAAKYGELAARPHIELVAPSLRWSTLAPDATFVIVAYVRGLPSTLRGGKTWGAPERTALDSLVMKAIAAHDSGFESRIVAKSVLTPDDIAREFRLTDGATTHGEITLDQILFMRTLAGYGRSAMPIDGLYLGGAGAHPGPGVTGGAGWLAAQRVLASKAKR